MELLRVELVKENGKLPTRAHEGDAGLDLYTPEEFLLLAGQYKRIMLGIAFDLYPNEVGLIQPRSSMSHNQIHTFTGVIDAGYKGEVGVMLQNLSKYEVTYKKHDRIAQILVMSVRLYDPIEKKIELISKRGTNGFGSTGK